jgi:transposase InsO family protein
MSLLKLITKSFNTNDQTYGYPRVHQDLKDACIPVGRHQVASLMREHGLVAKMKRKISCHARMKRFYSDEANRVGCCPIPDDKNSIWVGDITQINTVQQPFFLAAVMDRFTRRLIGVAMSERRNTLLVCRALQRAVKARKKAGAALFHSDQGVEYASYRYRDLLEENNIARSISRRGNCYDNAHMESFFHSLKTEMIYFQNFISPEFGMKKVKEYIKYYNEKRRHSSLGYLSPVQFERAMN